MVVLGRPSVVWLMNSMEALIKGDELRDFCRTFDMETHLTLCSDERTITKGLWSFRNMAVEGGVVLS